MKWSFLEQYSDRQVADLRHEGVFRPRVNLNHKYASGIYERKRSALIPIQQLQIHLETEVMKVQCI